MGAEPKPLPHVAPFGAALQKGGKADLTRQEASRALDRDREVYVKGEDEQHAVDVSDLNQIKGPDCFFVSGLAAIVRAHPQSDLFLRHILKFNDDGSYTITLYDFRGGARTTKEVTVGEAEVEELMRAHTELTTIQPDDWTPSHHPELWPLLLEKAYEKEFPERTKGNLDAGLAMERLTGLPSEHFPLGVATPLEGFKARLDLGTLDALHRNGHAITLTTFEKGFRETERPAFDVLHPENSPYRKEGQPEALSAGHVYFLTSVDATKGTVTVQNPWEGEHKDIVIPFKDLETVFAAAQTNPVQAPGTFVGGMAAYPKKELATSGG
jgi:hypothetical protein